MAEEKLGYSVHFHGVLEAAVECPLGKYYVDASAKTYFFEKKGDKKNAENISAIVAAVAAAAKIQGAEVIGIILENYARIPDEKVQKDGDKYTYDFRIEGDLELLATFDLGDIYADKTNQVVYFRAAHPKTFLAPIELQKVIDTIKDDVDDPEKGEAAFLLLSLLANWSPLDDEDIVE